MIKCLVLKKKFGCFQLFTWNIDLVCSFGGQEWLYWKENERHYVYDMFGHGKVITKPQALN